MAMVTSGRGGASACPDAPHSGGYLEASSSVRKLYLMWLEW